MSNTESNNMTSNTNVVDFINAQETVTVRWTEAEAETRENVEMTRGEFLLMLQRVCSEAIRDGLNGGAYLKVAFLAGGKSFRIDVSDDPRSTRLDNAWLY